MWHFLPGLTRRLFGEGWISGSVRPALIAGAPQAANANILLTRTFDARRMTAAQPSIFERARFLFSGAGEGAWSEVDDHAHVDRRAPPGRNPGGRDQGKPDRRI